MTNRRCNQRKRQQTCSKLSNNDIMILQRPFPKYISQINIKSQNNDQRTLVHSSSNVIVKRHRPIVLYFLIDPRIHKKGEKNQPCKHGFKDFVELIGRYGVRGFVRKSFECGSLQKRKEGRSIIGKRTIIAQYSSVKNKNVLIEKISDGREKELCLL